jgi:hypothetical protein
MKVMNKKLFILLALCSLSSAVFGKGVSFFIGNGTDQSVTVEIILYQVKLPSEEVVAVIAPKDFHKFHFEFPYCLEAVSVNGKKIQLPEDRAICGGAALKITSALGAQDINYKLERIRSDKQESMLNPNLGLFGNVNYH